MNIAAAVNSTFPPCFHHPPQESHTATTQPFHSHHNLHQSPFSAQNIRVQFNEAPCSLAAMYRPPSSASRSHRSCPTGRCFASSVGAEEQIDDGVFTSQSGKEKPSTFLVDKDFDSRLVTNLRDEASPLNSYSVSRGYGHAARSPRLKLVTRRHWELVNYFVSQEADIDRRLELKEACTNLVSTISSVRFILHNKYMTGESLEAIDEEIVEKILSYHPRKEEKLGCGLESIKIDIHPKFDRRCFFVVRKDGSATDFSFRKCVLELGQQTIGLDMTKRLLDLNSLD